MCFLSLIGYFEVSFEHSIEGVELLVRWFSGESQRLDLVDPHIFEDLVGLSQAGLRFHVLLTV